jgi:hypothetical protein
VRARGVGYEAVSASREVCVCVRGVWATKQSVHQGRCVCACEGCRHVCRMAVNTVEIRSLVPIKKYLDSTNHAPYERRCLSNLRAQVLGSVAMRVRVDTFSICPAVCVCACFEVLSVNTECPYRVSMLSVCNRCLFSVSTLSIRAQRLN